MIQPKIDLAEKFFNFQDKQSIVSFIYLFVYLWNVGKHVLRACTCIKLIPQHTCALTLCGLRFVPVSSSKTWILYIRDLVISVWAHIVINILYSVWLFNELLAKWYLWFVVLMYLGHKWSVWSTREPIEAIGSNLGYSRQSCRLLIPIIKDEEKIFSATGQGEQGKQKPLIKVYL